MRVTLETLKLVRDFRGWVFEPIGGDVLAAQRNAHVVWTEPGQIRGNHLHRLGSEVLVVLGPALVRIREDSEVKDYHVPDSVVCRFVIPPGVAHAVQNTGSAPGLLVGFNTQDHDPKRPDTEPVLLIEPVPNA